MGQSSFGVVLGILKAELYLLLDLQNSGAQRSNQAGREEFGTCWEEIFPVWLPVASSCDFSSMCPGGLAPRVLIPFGSAVLKRLLSSKNR